MKTDEKTPLVSCIIPSYKRNDTITRAIDSVISQTYPNIEILIVDDNEPGDSFSENLHNIVNSYQNPVVKLLTQPKHINGAAARNYGVKHAEGEYIAFLDDDDEWLPSKIEKQIKFIEQNPQFDAVAVCTSVYTNGKLKHVQRPYNVKDLQFKVLLRKVGIGTPAFLARRTSFLNIGGFDESLIRHQDLQLFVAFLDRYKIGLVPEVLVKVHSDSEINRPDLNKLIKIKKDYFDSIESYLTKYNSHERRRISCNHNYEIAYIALKEHKYLLFLNYMLKGGVSIAAIRDLIERYKKKR